MKLATWNVNSLKVRMPRVLELLEQPHPNDPGFTWWDHRQSHFQRRMGLRIDAFLLSRPVAGDLVECGIDRSFRAGPMASDHAPLLCRLLR